MLRYDSEATDDGLPPGEGAFLACSFWLAKAMRSPAGSREAARLVHRLLSLRNDVGLLAEGYEPVATTPGGELPAGVLARVAPEHRVQPRAQLLRSLRSSGRRTVTEEMANLRVPGPVSVIESGPWTPSHPPTASLSPTSVPRTSASASASTARPF